jgi:glycosyltransferase involved in cell wall biosynthesis
MNSLSLCWRLIASPCGTSRASASFIAALRNAGLTVLEEMIEEGGEPAGSCGQEACLFTVNHCQPRLFTYRKSRLNIGYTTFEAATIPEAWAHSCNAMDELWVYSSFNRQAFLESGVRRPPFIIPCGVDTASFHRKEKCSPYTPLERFYFLSIGSPSYRKGWDILTEAFSEEFSAHEPLCLILKSDAVYSDPFCRDWKRGMLSSEASVNEMLAKTAKKGPPVKLITDNLSIAEMVDLINSCQVYVSTSRGEGLSLPLMEAMACERIVIGPSFGGPLDYMTPLNSFLIEHRKKRMRCNYWGLKAFWGEPDLAHTRHLMRYTYEHYSSLQPVRSKARSDMVRKWSMDRSAGRLVGRLRELVR